MGWVFLLSRLQWIDSLSGKYFINDTQNVLSSCFGKPGRGEDWSVLNSMSRLSMSFFRSHGYTSPATGITRATRTGGVDGQIRL